jgi:Holliday junction resolvase
VRQDDGACAGGALEFRAFLRWLREGAAMSGRMSRDKGAAAERELCRLLSGELGVTVRRNVDQARSGGADCLELPGFAIEAKRREVLSRPAWWRQAVTQGLIAGAEPLVFYRQSRKPWRALITGMGGYRDVDWTQALDYIRDKLARLHGIYGVQA